MKKLFGALGIGALLIAAACNRTDHFGESDNNKQTDSSSKQTGVFKIKKAALDSVKIGKEIFESTCTSCHKMGGPMIGPDLTNVTKRKSRKWIGNFTRDPDAYLASDPYVKKLLAEYGSRMSAYPNMNDTAINFLCAYFEDYGKHHRKK